MNRLYYPQYGSEDYEPNYRPYMPNQRYLVEPVDYRIVSSLKAVNFLAQKYNLLTEELLKAHLKFNQILKGGYYESELLSYLGDYRDDSWFEDYINAGELTLEESLDLLKQFGQSIHHYRGRLNSLEKSLLTELERLGYDTYSLNNILSEINRKYSSASNLFYRSAYWGAKAEFFEDAVIILAGRRGLL